jgi:putative transcriptional regulator
MPLMRRWSPLTLALFFVVAPLLVAILPGAAAPNASPPDWSPSNSLAGQLLIAAPTIGDPRFYHTVVLLLRDDQDGAFGIVINRPVGERSIASLLRATGQPSAGVEGSLQVFAGGPVEPQLGFVVHTADYRRPGTLEVDGRIAMTANPQILQDIGHHHGPKESLFAFGYAGWGPGQLATEMARHDWFTTPEDRKLIFDDDRAGLWSEAMERRTREL